jgi:hypothetical protein
VIRALLVGLVAGLLAVSAFGGGTVAEAVKAPSTIPAAVQFRGTVDVKFKAPADNTWYECGHLAVPKGTWRISYRAMVYSSRPEADTGTVSAFATLLASTVATAEVDPDFQVGGRVGGNSYRAIFTLTAEKIVSLASPKTFHLLISESEGNGWESLQCLGERSTTLIRAERLG